MELPPHATVSESLRGEADIASASPRPVLDARRVFCSEGWLHGSNRGWPALDARRVFCSEGWLHGSNRGWPALDARRFHLQCVQAAVDAVAGQQLIVASDLGDATFVD